MTQHKKGGGHFEDDSNAAAKRPSPEAPVITRKSFVGPSPDTERHAAVAFVLYAIGAGFSREQCEALAVKIVEALDNLK